MKKLIILLNILLFCSCSSQKKVSLKQMNDHLLNKNYLYYNTTYLDSASIAGIKKTLTVFRISGAKSCHINPDKKYSNIYIEDGVGTESGYYDAIIILDNNEVCEITNSQNKLNIDSLSYTKVKGQFFNNDFVFYTKRISMENFKKDYVDEYFRYQVVFENKINQFDKCFNIDKHIPKSIIDMDIYYFSNKNIEKFYIPFKYYSTFKQNSIDYIPDLKDEKKKEFTDCVKSLGISID